MTNTHLKNIILTVVAIVASGCSSDDEKRKKLVWGTACFGDFSVRGNTCVRTSDQCPRSLIEDDSSCKQVPCNNNLFFDGNYCARADTSLPLDEEDAAEEPAPTPPFNDLCLKADWTSEQKYTNLGFITLGLEKKGLLGSEQFELSASEKTCALARDYIFANSTTKIEFPLSGLSDLTPINAFEYATNVEEIYLEVSRNTLMACPLTDTTRCKFIPFTDPYLKPVDNF